MVFDQSFSTEFGPYSHGINVYGRQRGSSQPKFYNGRSGSVCNVLFGGNLDVGVGATSSKVDSNSNQQVFTAVTEIHSQPPWISKLEFITTHPTPRSFIFLKGSIYFE